MNNADLTEMEFLASALSSTAERLQRAVTLLRAAGDLERLQAKLSRLTATTSPPLAAALPAAPPPIIGRAAEIPAGRAVDSATMPVGRSCGGAVFDDERDGRLKLGKNLAGVRRPPF